MAAPQLLDECKVQSLTPFSAPGFAADAELLAQIRNRKAIGVRQRDETNNLFHGCDILPGHRARMCNPSLRIVCHLSCRFEPPSLFRTA